MKKFLLLFFLLWFVPKLQAQAPPRPLMVDSNSLVITTNFYLANTPGLQLSLITGGTNALASSNFVVSLFSTSTNNGWIAATNTLWGNTVLYVNSTVASSTNGVYTYIINATNTLATNLILSVKSSSGIFTNTLSAPGTNIFNVNNVVLDNVQSIVVSNKITSQFATITNLTVTTLNLSALSVATLNATNINAAIIAATNITAANSVTASNISATVRFTFPDTSTMTNAANAAGLTNYATGIGTAATNLINFTALSGTTNLNNASNSILAQLTVATNTVTTNILPLIKAGLTNNNAAPVSFPGGFAATSTNIFGTNTVILENTQSINVSNKITSQFATITNLGVTFLLNTPTLIATNITAPGTNTFGTNNVTLETVVNLIATSATISSFNVLTNNANQINSGNINNTNGITTGTITATGTNSFGTNLVSLGYFGSLYTTNLNIFPGGISALGTNHFGTNFMTQVYFGNGVFTNTLAGNTISTTNLSATNAGFQIVTLSSNLITVAPIYSTSAGNFVLLSATNTFYSPGSNFFGTNYVYQEYAQFLNISNNLISEFATITNLTVPYQISVSNLYADVIYGGNLTLTNAGSFLTNDVNILNASILTVSNTATVFSNLYANIVTTTNLFPGSNGVTFPDGYSEYSAVETILPVLGLNFKIFGSGRTQTLAISNITTGLYNVIHAYGPDNAPTFQLDAGTNNPTPIAGGNYWIFGHSLALKNLTTGSYCTMVCSGVDGMQTPGLLFGYPSPFASFIPSYGIITNALGMYNLTTSLTNTVYAYGSNGVQTLVLNP